MAKEMPYGVSWGSVETLWVDDTIDTGVSYQSRQGFKGDLMCGKRREGVARGCARGVGTIFGHHRCLKVPLMLELSRDGVEHMKA